MIAGKTGAQLPAIVARVAAGGGPSASGTTAAEFVRFHDDLSTYTGKSKWDAPPKVEFLPALQRHLCCRSPEPCGLFLGRPVPCTGGEYLPPAHPVPSRFLGQPALCSWCFCRRC